MSCKKGSSNPVVGKRRDVPREEREESEGDKLCSGNAVRILKACHSEATCRYTKMHKWIAERFYWKGMVADVRKLVSSVLYNLQAGCQIQSDCARLAKYREQLPGILRLTKLTGAALSRVPTYEQEDRERETRAESKPGEVTLVSWSSLLGMVYLTCFFFISLQPFFIVELQNVITSDQGPGKGASKQPELGVDEFIWD